MLSEVNEQRGKLIGEFICAAVLKPWPAKIPYVGNVHTVESYYETHLQVCGSLKYVTNCKQ